VPDELPATTRRVVGSRGARASDAHAPAVSRPTNRPAPAAKRTPVAKPAVAARGASASAVKTKPAATRTSVLNKRIATKQAPSDGKGTADATVARKRTAATTGRKPPVARKTTSTARKAKRR